MWKDWAKKCGVVAAIGAVIWAIFFAHLGSQPISDHVVDVWESAVMREKRNLLQHEVRKLFKTNAWRVGPGKAKLSQRPKSQRKYNDSDLTDSDRRSLDDLIDSALD